jgi:ferric-dicitrate binding protein FerR (iron transport regulator)
LDRVRRLWTSAEQMPEHMASRFDADVAWRTVQQHLDRAPAKGAESSGVESSSARPSLRLERSASRRRVLPMSRARWLWAGVAVLMCAVIGALTMSPTGSATTSHVYATTNGQQARVRLPDGTTVLLGDASALTVPSHFGERSRTVTLRGEAYFTVARVSGTPFAVEAANSVTRVLGTTFGIRKYASDRTVRVIVASGKVSLGVLRVAHGGEAILSAQTLGQVSDSGRITVQPNIAIADELGWTSGRLQFRDTPFGDAIPDLERHFNIVIRVVDSSLTTIPITGSFATESLDEIPALLAFTLRAQATRSGRVITLSARSHGAAPVQPSHPFVSERQYGR